MERLAGKIALVTGGNSGIGLATVQTFLDEGAYVILTGRNREAVDKAVAELAHKQVSGLIGDVSSLSQISTLIETIKNQFGRLDILFVNAGVAALGPFDSLTEAQFDYNMNINFKGAFFTIQKALPLLSEGASIILNTSLNAHVGMPNSSVYAASKAALLVLGKVLATELAPRGIRVNAISPGPVQTPMYGKLGFSEEALSGMANALGQKILLGRFGTPEEIAKTALFFASDDSSFVTGAELFVDGGLSVNPIMQ